MDNAAEKLNVSSVDIFKFESFIGKYVTIQLDSPLREVNGLVYTIDPVSESVVLVNKEDGKFSLDIVLKHSRKEILIKNEVPEELQDVDLTKLFANKHESEKTAHPGHKEQVIRWIQASNMIFSEESGVIVVEDVRIMPPYTSNDCICDNPIKLKSFQQLLTTITSLDPTSLTKSVEVMELSESRLAGEQEMS